LLLAILLLSAILAITFSLASILFFQVRTSADFARTEGAFYAADGVAEQALFNTVRQVTTPSYVSSFSNNSVLNGQPVSSSTTTPIFQDTVAANSTFLTTKNKYDFCNVTSGAAGCGYGKISLTYLATGNTDPLVVYLCQFDPTKTYNSAPCTSTSTPENGPSYWITTSNSSLPDTPSDPNGTLISPGGASTLTWATSTSSLDPTLQQQLILFTQSQNPIYVSIHTFDANGNPLGLPISGKTAVSIDAVNGETGRKIQVIVPNPDSN